MRARPKKNSDSISKYRFIGHFIPHKQTKSRARLLTHGALMAYSVVLVVLFLAIKLMPSFAPGILGYASNIEVAALLEYTNQRRASIGLNDLKLNPTLSNAAYKKANDMFKVDYWAHVSPLGTKPWDFILGEGYDYIYAGENLAKNFSSSRDVVDAWYESPSHRENLLSPNYDDIGFAVVNGTLDGYETTIVVQMFGKTRQPTQLAAVGGSETSAEQLALNDSSVENELPVQLDEGNDTVNSESEVLKIQQNVTDTDSAPVIDVRGVTASVTVVFGGFITSLLGVDIWYSKKHGIFKLTGHTVAHLLFLVVVIATVMLSLFPGVIL